MQIRCTVCGFTRESFHGWVFTTDACYGKTDKHYGMLHKWERVDEDAAPADDRPPVSRP